MEYILTKPLLDTQMAFLKLSYVYVNCLQTVQILSHVYFIYWKQSDSYIYIGEHILKDAYSSLKL